MKSVLKYCMLLFCVNFIEGAFRCDYKYSSKAQAWFKHFVIPATWFDARLRCTLEGAILASPTTPQIKNEMKKIINASATQSVEYFTGIHATFSQGDYYTIEGLPLSELPVTWTEGEPDNKDNKESCLTINIDGNLADQRCEETRPYICYHKENNLKITNECGTIDPGYNLDPRTNKCYKFHTVPRNFSRAFMTCSAEGGHLAIINSAVEATVLKDLFAKYPASSMVGNFWKELAFIGVHDSNEKWDWRTIYGQTLVEAGYSAYSPGEPNTSAPIESCGGIFRSGLLVDLWCDKPAAFICEMNPSLPASCQNNY